MSDLTIPETIIPDQRPGAILSTRLAQQHISELMQRYQALYSLILENEGTDKQRYIYLLESFSRIK